MAVGGTLCFRFLYFFDEGPEGMCNAEIKADGVQQYTLAGQNSRAHFVIILVVDRGKLRQPGYARDLLTGLERVRAPKDPGQAAQLLPMCPDEVEVVDGGSRADAL